MEIRRFQGEASEWNRLIAGLAQTHVMQSWEWGQVKAQFGWQPAFYVWVDANGVERAAALVLMRELKLPGVPVGLRVLYVPKGPLLDWKDADLRRAVLGDLSTLSVQLGAIFIKVDPDLPLYSGAREASQPGSDGTVTEVVQELAERGWRLSDEQIQFRNTIVLDLQPALDELLGRMKQKTRYNIRLAERKGVQIRRSRAAADWALLYNMYAETANRDVFVIRNETYYQALWQTFAQANMLDAFIAETGGEMVAAIVVLHFGGWAWYMHGMSSAAHREKMPNYLLQWEAIRWLKTQGVHDYDLWGAPDELVESDPLWGVYRFKEGLGGEFVCHIGAWDLPVRKKLYTFYTKTLPRILDLMRWRGKRETRRLAGG